MELDPKLDPFSREAIQHLAARYGSPLLVIDAERVRQQYRRLGAALPGVDLHYALKPLPHAALITTLMAEGALFRPGDQRRSRIGAPLGSRSKALHPHAPDQARQRHSHGVELWRRAFRHRQSGRVAQVRAVSQQKLALDSGFLSQSRRAGGSVAQIRLRSGSGRRSVPTRGRIAHQDRRAVISHRLAECRLCDDGQGHRGVPWAAAKCGGGGSSGAHARYRRRIPGAVSEAGAVHRRILRARSTPRSKNCRPMCA